MLCYHVSIFTLPPRKYHRCYPQCHSNTQIAGALVYLTILYIIIHSFNDTLSRWAYFALLEAGPLCLWTSPATIDIRLLTRYRSTNPLIMTDRPSYHSFNLICSSRMTSNIILPLGISTPSIAPITSPISTLPSEILLCIFENLIVDTVAYQNRCRGAAEYSELLLLVCRG